MDNVLALILLEKIQNLDHPESSCYLKALNPNPDAVKDAAQDGTLAKRRVNVARSKIDKRDPYVKAAIDRRNLSL